MVRLHEGLTNRDKARVVLMTMDKEQLIPILLEAASQRWVEECASYYDYCVDTDAPPFVSDDPV